MGELACRLARESVFGEELMAACTVQGLRGNAALPREGIALIKETIIQQRFPVMTGDSLALKSIWKSCTDALNHSCSKLRRQKKQKQRDIHTNA